MLRRTKGSPGGGWSPILNPIGHPKNGTTVIGIGVVGAGYWGPRLVRNFCELSGSVVRAVSERRPDRRRQIEQFAPAIRTTSDYADLLDDPSIDAIVVATPIRTHYSLARQALLHGKHVFVEKPLTGSSIEAQELIEIAEDRHLCLMVGHTFEYNPAVEELRKLVLRGEVGKIHYVDAARLSLGLLQEDVNVLWDLAPHDISILRYVLGMEPVTVRAHGKAYIRPQIEDVAYMELLFPNDIMAHVHMSWLEPCKVRRVTIVGDRKMVVYNDVAAEEKIKIYDKGVSLPTPTKTFTECQLSYRYGDVICPRVPWEEPLRLECSHFLESIRTGRLPRSDGWSGLQVVRILERATESLELGGVRVRIEDGAVDATPLSRSLSVAPIPAAS